MAQVSYTYAQQQRQIAMSRAGGKATSAKDRSHRLFVGRAYFLTLIINNGNDLNIFTIVTTYVIAVYEQGLKPEQEFSLKRAPGRRTQCSRQRSTQLIQQVNRDAIWALRALGGTWDQVFDLLVSEDDRIQEDQKR